MEKTTSYQFGPVDWQQMRLLIDLPAHKRIRLMLDARELALGLVRGRIRRRYPNLSEAELNFKVLEATTNVQPTKIRPGTIPGNPSDS